MSNTTNPSDFAFPHTAPDGNDYNLGLTKRELFLKDFAVAIIQHHGSYNSDNLTGFTPVDCMHTASEYVDALTNELNGKPETENGYSAADEQPF